MFLLVLFCLVFSVLRTDGVKNAELTSIEEYPSLVSATKVTDRRKTGTTTSTTFYAAYGTLITMDWFLTSVFQADLLKKDYGIGWTIQGGSSNQLPDEGEETSKYLQVVYAGKQSGSYSTDDDELALVRFTPAFKNSSSWIYIQAANLPPDPHFSSKCKDVTIVGWGSTESYNDFRDLVNKVQRSQLLSRSYATIIECVGYMKHFNKANLNNFCLELNDTEASFCGQDSGLPIFCNNDTLIGIVQGYYGEGRFSRCAGKAYATNISQYMTWLKSTTGVKVPFESMPMYSTTTTTTYKYNPRGEAEEKTDKFRLYTPDDETSPTDWSSGADLRADFWGIVVAIMTVVFLQRRM